MLAKLKMYEIYPEIVKNPRSLRYIDKDSADL